MLDDFDDLGGNRAGQIKLGRHVSPHVRTLAAIVRRQKVTQARLSRDAGISTKALANWFRAGTSPTVDMLDAVLQTMGWRMAVVPAAEVVLPENNGYTPSERKIMAALQERSGVEVEDMSNIIGTTNVATTRVLVSKLNKKLVGRRITSKENIFRLKETPCPTTAAG